MEMAWKDVPKRKAGQRALFVFLFTCLIPAAWDAVALLSNGTCHSPSFSCSWVSCHSAGSELLEAAVPRPCQQLCLGPGPQEQWWRWASVFGTFFCLSFTEKKVSPSLSPDFLLCWLLPPLSVPGGYFGISVCVNSYMTWQSFQGCQPLSCRCFKDGSPCRLQESALQSPVSPTACRTSVFVLLLGLQPAHMLFGQDPILLVFEDSRGKIKLSEDAQLACGTLILTDPQCYSRSAWGNLLFQFNTSALNCFWPLFLWAGILDLSDSINTQSTSGEHSCLIKGRNASCSVLEQS